MFPKRTLYKKKECIRLLLQLAALFLIGMSTACTEPAILTPTPTAVSPQATATTLATAVPTAPPIPTPTAIPALPVITQPLRSDPMIRFVRDGKLWRADVQGVALTKLGSDDFLSWGEAEGFGIASLRLSPDGRWLANPVHQDNKLHILDLGTGQERVLPVSSTELAWSPDSRTLAYAPVRNFPTSPSPNCTLCLYDLASDTYTSLIPNSDPSLESIHHLIWSADGLQLAYACCFVPREPYEGISDGRIETIHLGTGEHSEAGPLTSSVGGGVARFCWRDGQIVTTDFVDGDRCAASPGDWLNPISQDNLLAAWEAVPDSSNWTTTRLSVTNRATGELVWERMLETTSPIRLGWSPDGRYLFFNDGSTAPIWRLTADNSELRQIAPADLLLGIVDLRE